MATWSTKKWQTHTPWNNCRKNRCCARLQNVYIYIYGSKAWLFLLLFTHNRTPRGMHPFRLLPSRCLRRNHPPACTSRKSCLRQCWWSWPRRPLQTAPSCLFTDPNNYNNKNMQHIRPRGIWAHTYKRRYDKCWPRHTYIRGQKYSGRRETISFTEPSPSSAVWDVAGLQPGLSPICPFFPLN